MVDASPVSPTFCGAAQQSFVSCEWPLIAREKIKPGFWGRQCFPLHLVVGTLCMKGVLSPNSSHAWPFSYDSFTEKVLVENVLSSGEAISVVGTEQGPWSQTVQIPVPALPLTSSLASGKPLTSCASISSSVKQISELRPHRAVL